MQLAELREHLQRLSQITNEEWLSSLDARKKAELDFHNRDRDRTKIKALNQDDFEKYYSNTKYYGVTARSVKSSSDWIAANVPGKIFLDYACGNGSDAIRAAKAGAALAIGIDISNISVQNARKEAEAQGLTNTFFLQADAENTRLPDGCIDVAVCNGMLHHLDLSYAFPELRRILAPGGRILATEALKYNPFIQLYRLLTPAMRTDWEKTHILGFKDLEFARRFFSVRNIRYWHVAGYLGAHARWASGALDLMDRVIESTPLFRRMAWIFTFELHSLKNDTPQIP